MIPRRDSGILQVTLPFFFCPFFCPFIPLYILWEKMIFRLDSHHEPSSFSLKALCLLGKGFWTSR